MLKLHGLPISRGSKVFTLLAAVLLTWVPPGLSTASAAASPVEDTSPLEGVWLFRTDPEDRGIAAGWFKPGQDRADWRKVSVPHTWQVDPGTEEYYGFAWYARQIDGDPDWRGRTLRLEFDAVYRDARVWVNGQPAGEHLGSGWTPFNLPVTAMIDPDGPNLIVVRVDNRFSPTAIPYERSFDWAADGGIIRGVRIRSLPPAHLDHILVSGDPAPGLASAQVRIRAKAVSVPAEGSRVRATVYDPDGNRVATVFSPLTPGEDGTAELDLQTVLARPQLWHFDFPRLYRLQLDLLLTSGVAHTRETVFGIRRVEVRKGFFYLNEEPMRLLGLEWMPGSDPRFGMAEPAWRMEQVLSDMKRLNVTFTRFHWQQDRAVLEFCDREGILVQEEIPAWGPDTMKGELDVPQALQTRAMVLAHHNHPSIFAWGLCNEIGGQRPEAHGFVRRGIELVRELDPLRAVTWASNSLQRTPEKDASSLVDFIEWNDYWESWYGGTLANLEANLQSIAEAYPEKGLVISEYGLCECDPRNPSGDARRIEILRTHTDLYRAAPQVAGAIFFSYNDYRTHIGDKGQGAYRQRVHGVVDLLDRRKPSWDALRREASPIRSLEIGIPDRQGEENRLPVLLDTRSLQDLPAYTLRGYRLVWTVFNDLDQPIAGGADTLPDLAPGVRHRHVVTWPGAGAGVRAKVEVFRPTGWSVEWAERPINN